MSEVVVVADRAESTSQQVLAGVGDIKQRSGRVRHEVDQFLVAVRIDAQERRRFERFQTGTRVAVLKVPGRNAAEVQLLNLSERGAGIWGDLALSVGTDVSLEVENIDGALPAKVARNEGNQVFAIEFPDDEALRLRIKNALAALLPQGVAKAA